MSAKFLACLLTGLATAQVALSLGFYPGLAASAHEVAPAAAATYYVLFVRWGLRVGLVLLPLSFLHLLETHRVLRRRETSSTMPPYPFDPHITRLVIGEVHEQDGRPSSTPGYLTLDEKALSAGLLVLGATGAGKTSAALNPYLHQLIRLHADDPQKKLAGLVIDPKGNMAADLRVMAAACGRERDIYEIKMPTARYNLLNRPDLHPIALAGYISDVLLNIQGSKSHSDPFWGTASRELAGQCLRAIALAERRPATMADLYRASASERAFAGMLTKAQSRRDSMTAEQTAELDSLEYWHNYTLAAQDPKTRASIAAQLSGIASLFDAPEIKECFCPLPHDETFLGWEEVIDRGLIVVLSLPHTTLRQIATIVGTFAKLGYQDCLLTRLAQSQGTNQTVGRTAFLVADEYDCFVSQPGDGHFLAKCREAKCLTILATQSLTSLGAKIKDPTSLEQLVAQFRSVIWLTINDNTTAEQAAKLCGRIDRDKTSRAVSESAQRAAFSFLDKQQLAEGRASASASVSYAPHEEYLFPPRVFTSLRTGQAVVRAFDGEQVLPPWVVFLRRLDQLIRDPNASWFSDNRPTR